jgi:HNH endonuclease
VTPQRVIERALASLGPPDENGCRHSGYSVGGHGYAQVGWNEGGRSHMRLVHRVVWEAHNGEVPEGMTVDHTCHVKKCGEIGHLRLLTNFDNARRTSGRDWPLGQCIRGHSDEHLHTSPNGRTRCRKCKADDQRAYRARRKEAV